VYCGLKPGAGQHIPHTMHFWYDSMDDKKIFHNICTNSKKTIDHLAFLKTAQDSELPTLTLMNFVHKSFSNDWKQEKKRIAEQMLTKAESLYPGLRENIVCMEIGSPDTFERYTLNTDGALYGFENIKTMYGEAKMPSITHLSNLYQTGHWGKPGCGIWNVMSNAYGTSKIILQYRA
jgi:phytoene dehydrogenase-like protein